MTTQGNSAIYNMTYPAAKFQNQEGVCRVKTVTVNLLAVAGNTLLIAAVASKKIQIVGGSVFSSGAATILSFRDGNAGTVNKYLYVPANTVANPNIPLIATIDDVIDTTAGNGLYVDNSTTTVFLTINYIEYTQ
jgi:hypothetical protein